MFPFYSVSSYYLVTTGVTVNTDNVVFSFLNHAFLRAPYRGTLYINLQLSISSDTVLPIVFETNGVTQSVKKIGNEDLTTADITGTGVYEFWYDKSNNLLLLIS